MHDQEQLGFVNRQDSELPEVKNRRQLFNVNDDDDNKKNDKKHKKKRKHKKDKKDRRKSRKNEKNELDQSAAIRGNETINNLTIGAD